MKVKCISRYTLVSEKTGKDIRTCDDVREDGERGDAIYEVDDKLAKKLLATGDFEGVESP